MRVVSFYTPNWEYKAHAENLKRDCERLGIPSYIEELPDTGSYLKNCCMKPEFIRDCLKHFKEPVLWIDCDGSLLKKPALLYGLDIDFAGRRMQNHHTGNRIWHVGTLWFNYNERVLEFMDKWCKNTGAVTDESAFDRTWKEHPMGMTHASLPASYFEILRRGGQPNPESVICHRISSGPVKRREEPKCIMMEKQGKF